MGSYSKQVWLINIELLYPPGVPELESDSSSMYSATPRNSSHQYHHHSQALHHHHPGQQSPAMSIPGAGSTGQMETQHASLRRRKGEGSSPSDRSQSLQVDTGGGGNVTPRPLSMVVPSQSDANMAMSPSSGSLHRGVRRFLCTA